jgi:hypothetical protein
VGNNSSTNANDWSNTAFQRLSDDDADEEYDDKEACEDKASKNLWALKFVENPRWPSYTQLPFWKPQMVANLASVSRRADRNEIVWFKEIEAESFEELADPGSARMCFVDQLACPKLVDVLPEKLPDEIQRLQLDALVDGILPSSRQVVIVASDRTSVVCGVGELIDVQWFGGERGDEFLRVARFVRENIPAPDQLSDNARRDVFIEQMEKSVALKEALAHFRRLKHGPEKNRLRVVVP